MTRAAADRLFPSASIALAAATRSASSRRGCPPRRPRRRAASSPATTRSRISARSYCAGLANNPALPVERGAPAGDAGGRHPAPLGDRERAALGLGCQMGSTAKCESPTFAGVCPSETPLARTYRHLDLDERRTLFRLVEARRPVGEIAARLGRHPSTIHRELGRTRFRDGDRGFCGYFPLTAQDLARRRRQRRRKLAADEGLRTHVVERLKAGWSPQRIAGRLRHEADGGPTVCHETIYRHVYGPEGRRDGLYRHLPKARRRRGRRYGRKPRSSPIPRERWIENRPAEVGDRQAFGHWRPTC